MELSDFALAFITLVVTCAVPWSYKVHGRLTAIEVSIKDAKELTLTISVMREEMHRIDIRMAKIENTD